MPLAVAANEIIIGGLSHSSSTAAWQSGTVVRRWCGGGSGDGSSEYGGGCIPTLGDRRRRGCERVTGSNVACGRAREGGRGRTKGTRGERGREREIEREVEERGEGGRGVGGLGGGRVVVFEMIRPICASFPRCTPPPPRRAPGRARSGKPAWIPHHRKQRGSPVECHISRQRRSGRGCRSEKAREGPRAFAARRMKREEDRDR